MNDAVGAEDINSNNSRVEVDGKAPQPNLRAEPLGKAANVLALECCWDGSAHQNPACGEELF